MQNQINSQYIAQNQGYNGHNQPLGQAQIQPAYTQPIYYPTQGYPTSSVGAVNIQIFNPTANPQGQGFYQAVPCAPYPCNYNNMIQSSPIQPTQTNNAQFDSNINQAMAMNEAQNGVAAQAQTEDKAKAEQKNDKPKVALTDTYVKTLENYLNSQDKKIRLMGAKELFDRFKEDETRKDDAALTALLNKVLQDPAETVKFVGLTTLDAGYATGNNETAQILTQMQSSTSSYGEDAALASQILLKMSGYQANAEAAALQGQAGLTSGDTNLNQNAISMPQPALQNIQNNMNSIDTKLPPTDTDTLLKNNATINQTMQAVPNNGADLNQQMISPIDNKAVK